MLAKDEYIRRFSGRRTPVVKTLLRAGSSATAANNEGLTALDITEQRPRCPPGIIQALTAAAAAAPASASTPAPAL